MKSLVSKFYFILISYFLFCHFIFGHMFTKACLYAGKVPILAMEKNYIILLLQLKTQKVKSIKEPCIRFTQENLMEF